MELSMDKEPLKKGYKRSEVGVIPEEWDVKTAAELCTKIQDGTHFSPKQKGNDYLYVTSKNIGHGTLDVTDAGRIDTEQHKAIYSRCDVKKGDLLLTKDGASTGNAAINHLDEEFSLLSSVAILRFDNSYIVPEFYLQYLLSFPGKEQILRMMSGNAITRLTLEKIRQLRAPVPQKNEQESIATALSDVDALIAALDKLIAKKRAIKTAAMQQLLTGKKRLPGFGEGKGFKKTELGMIPEDWEARSLDSFATVSSGKRLPLGKSLSEQETPYPYIRVADMRPGTICLADIKYVPVDVFPSIKRFRIYTEDIFISVAGTLGIVGQIPPELNGANLTENANRITDISCSREYLLHVMMSHLIQNRINSLQTVGAQPKLALTRIRKFLIPLPPTVAEQEAIATTLADMDTEITTLETRRQKNQSIKQAMMQELLTGRTRLI